MDMTTSYHMLRPVSVSTVNYNWVIDCECELGIEPPPNDSIIASIGHAAAHWLSISIYL